MRRALAVDDAFAAADALRERGVGAALIKLADGGVVLVSAGEREHIPALASRRVDTTGAGDAFAGALAVRHFGSQAAKPDRATLDAAVAGGSQADSSAR